MRGGLRSRALAALAMAVTAACGDDPFVYEGTPGRPIPAELGSWVASVPVSVDGAEPAPFLVDTGAPLTMLDRDAFPARDEGVARVGLGAFELTIPEHPALVFDVFPYHRADEDALSGIVGGDVLRNFALTLDYQDPRVWLEIAPDGLPEGVDASAVEDPVAVGADLRGGGEARVPGDCDGGCGTIDVDATRFLVEVVLEEETEPRWMLVDTGATAVVLDPEVADALPDAGRPRLDGVTVGTASGETTAYFTRLSRLQVAGGPSATSVSVLVLPDEALFPGLSAEVGADVDGLLGASFLRRFLTTIDYPDETLRLARYGSLRHIDPDEFVRVGFTMTRRDGAWRVQDVYPDTDARAEGLTSGELIVELDGTDITDASEAQVVGILDRFERGDEVPVGVMRGELEVVLVAVEDLLPAYPSQ